MVKGSATQAHNKNQEEAVPFRAKPVPASQLALVLVLVLVLAPKLPFPDAVCTYNKRHIDTRPFLCAHQLTKRQSPTPDSVYLATFHSWAALAVPSVYVPSRKRDAAAPFCQGFIKGPCVPNFAVL